MCGLARSMRIARTSFLIRFTSRARSTLAASFRTFRAFAAWSSRCYIGALRPRVQHEPDVFSPASSSDGLEQDVVLDFGPEAFYLAAQVSPGLFRRDQLDVVDQRGVEVVDRAENRAFERVALPRKHAAPVEPFFWGHSQLHLRAALDASVRTG